MKMAFKIQTVINPQNLKLSLEIFKLFKRVQKLEALKGFFSLC